MSSNAIPRSLCILLGINNERTLTIYNDSSNVPTFYSAASINAFSTFMTPGTVEREDLFILETTVLEKPIEENNDALPVVSDDEGSTSSVSPPVDNHQSEFTVPTPSHAPRSKINPKRSTEPLGSNTIERNSRDHITSEENISDFSELMPSPTDILPNDLGVEAKVLSDTAGFLRWHYKLIHLSFRKMKALATLGILPTKYRHLESPVCKACQYGKQHRRPWRTKGQQSKIKPVRVPGQCVSVDKMESSLDGFVAQLKDSLTKRRYKGATIFRDHATNYIHVSLMTDFTGEATANACRKFEVSSSEMGVTVRHYHCDNGQFADNKFLAHCKTNRISVSYCGVNAHHQNGLAECTIGILRDEARVALWHVVFRWPSMLLLNL